MSGPVSMYACSWASILQCAVILATLFHLNKVIFPRYFRGNRAAGHIFLAPNRAGPDLSTSSLNLSVIILFPIFLLSLVMPMPLGLMVGEASGWQIKAN